MNGIFVILSGGMVEDLSAHGSLGQSMLTL
jgi:hypothetical protein